MIPRQNEPRRGWVQTCWYVQRTNTRRRPVERIGGDLGLLTETNHRSQNVLTVGLPRRITPGAKTFSTACRNVTGDLDFYASVMEENPLLAHSRCVQA